jgi:hypothetical protein
VHPSLLFRGGVSRVWQASVLALSLAPCLVLAVDRTVPPPHRRNLCSLSTDRRTQGSGGNGGMPCMSLSPKNRCLSGTTRVSKPCSTPPHSTTSPEGSSSRFRTRTGRYKLAYRSRPVISSRRRESDHIPFSTRQPQKACGSLPRHHHHPPDGQPRAATSQLRALPQSGHRVGRQGEEKKIIPCGNSPPLDAGVLVSVSGWEVGDQPANLALLEGRR